MNPPAESALVAAARWVEREVGLTPVAALPSNLLAPLQALFDALPPTPSADYCDYCGWVEPDAHIFSCPTRQDR